MSALAAMRVMVAAVVLFPLVVGCPTRSREPAAAGRAPIQLRDVAVEAGLDYRYRHPGSSPFNILQLTSGGGAAFLDYDGDGWLDILCVGWPRPALFRGDASLRFTDVTSAAGLDCPEAIWSGCATGDLNNDRFVDLVLTGYRRLALFINDGGRFREATREMGLDVPGWSTSAAFADVDRDGFLDLYVGRYLRFEAGMSEFETVRGVRLALPPEVYESERGLFFRNRGGKRFEEATLEAGLGTAQGKALGVAFGDPESRGWDDLYIANDGRMQDYFRNDGSGRFRSIGHENGTGFESEGGPQGGMGVDFGDYDGDGLLDLFVANFEDEPKSLYRNTGGGLFEHAAGAAGIAQRTRPWVAFGAKFVDLDLDSHLDLVILNGHVRDLIRKVDPGNSYPQRPQLFHNAGGGKFTDLSDGVGSDFREVMVGRGLAIGDYDNDGDPDLLAADLEGRARLFRNEKGRETANWVSMALNGKRSNRMAIGSRIELVAGGRTQIREVRTDGSYLSAHDPRVHFGLGTEGRVERITIHWPSGKSQTLRDVAVNQLLEVREP